MKKGRNLIQIAVLTGLLALTVALSACGEGTVTEAVGAEAIKTSSPIPISDLTLQAQTDSNNATQSALIYQLLYAGTIEATRKSESFACQFPLSYSRDMNWVMCLEYPNFQFMNQDGKEWDFSYEEYMGRSIDRTNFIHWSQDGQFVYFAGEGEHDSPYPFPYNAWFLLRLDLENGEIQKILPERSSELYPNDWIYYVISISPTDRRLAYIINQPDLVNQISILDLKTGEEKNISIGQYGLAGWFSWSDDGTELSFQAFDTGTQQFYRITYDVLTLTFLNSELLSEPQWNP
jgi:hypothetical protein